MKSGDLIVSEAKRNSEQSLRAPWWSFTKTVLAGAALVLVDQRKLRLDAPLDGKQYSLRHLLQHTSGLPDYGGLPEYNAAVAAAEEPWLAEELLSRVKSNELLFTPGASWAYSNVGYLVVRQLIEQVFGADLDRAIRALVLSPLGIDRTSMAVSAKDLEATIWRNKKHYDPGWVYHGLLVGTPSDAALLLEGLLYGTLLSDHLRDEMLAVVPVGGPFSGRPAIAPGYGLGVMIDSQSAFGRMIGHSGQGPGSTCAVYSFPDLKPRRTLAAFAPGDDSEVLGALERHILALVFPTYP